MENDPSAFLDPRAETEKRGAKLPHWQQETVAALITWRLADSLPQSVITTWKAERDAWLKHHPKPWNKQTEKQFHTGFSDKLDEWLDDGSGACILREKALAEIVSSALHFYDQVRYHLFGYVIMPNHTHVLFRPLNDHSIPQIVKVWKGFSAREINKALDSKGSVWLSGYWDRLIRSEEHLAKCLHYIRDNPKTANLASGHYLHFEP